MPVFNNILAGAAGQSGGAYKIERSLRFTDTHSASLTKTFSSAGDRKRFTISLWVKRGKLGKSYQPFLMNTNGSGTEGLYFNFSGDYLQFGEYASNGWRWQLQSESQYRDCSAWYSIIASVDTTQATASDRVKLTVNGEQITTFYSGLDTYPSQNLDIQFNNTSLHAIGRLGANTSTNYHFDGLMAEFHFVDGAALPASDFAKINADTGVWSPIKYAGSHNVGSGVNGFYLDFADNSSNAALGYDAAGSNNWNVNNIAAKSNGWPEAVYAGDATYNINETSKSFYTGTGADLFDGTTNNYVGGQNASNSWLYFRPTTAITGVTSIELYGAYNGGGTKVNGSDVSVSPSWTTLDQWVSISNPPSSISSIAVKGTSGAAARLKAIKVNGTILTDVPASEIDSFIDSPVNYESDSGNNRGNYASLNPLANGSGSAPANGNLDITTTDGSYGDIGTTIAPTSGKFYVEFTIKSDADRAMIGIASNSTFAANTQFHTLPDAWAYYSTGGVLYNNSASSNFGDSYGPNDVIGIALDKDNNKLYFSKNGTFQNSSNPSAGTGGIDISSVSGKPSFFIVNDVSSAAKTSVAFNAGQRPFATSSVPTGFKSLCTQNLDDPLIADGTDYFDAKPYVGNGGTQTITGFSFQPSLLWTKVRDQAGNHKLVDAVRGVSKRLEPDTTDTEETATTGVTSFNSDGFTVGSSGTQNGNNYSLMSWAWDGGNLVTNSAYNQSEVWSGMTSTSGNYSQYSTFGPEKLFNGSTSDGWQFSGTTASAIFTPTSPISYSSQVRVYIGATGNTANTQWKVNSGSYQSFSSSGAQWLTVLTGSGTFSRFELYQNGDAYTMQMAAIEVDGKILVDPGVIPVGSLNSTAYNQSAVWSSGMTVTSGSITNSSNAFNGDIGDYAVADTFSEDIVVNLGNTLDGILEVYGSSGATHDVNGQTKLEANASGWHKVGTCTSGTTTTYTCAGASNAYAAIRAIRVAGKILVDQGTTPAVNVPSIASTCRANQTAGISISTYTGSGSASTIGHGLLNATPEFLIVKDRTSSATWFVYHKGIGATKYLKLETTSAQATGALWNNTEPTSSVVSSSGSSTGSSGKDYLMLAWAPVEGFSKFGSYVSNNNVDGPFVYLGFQAKLIIWKNADANHGWYMYDDARDPNNPMSKYLAVHLSDAEGDPGGAMDVLSNGFKVRNTGFDMNTSTNTILYMAWAESPFKYNRAR